MNNPLTAEIVDGFDSLLVRELIGLQQTAFPPQMQFQEPERYYQEALCNSRNVNVVTRSSEGSVIGYLLAMPLTDVCSELRQWDPQIQKDPVGMYIDIIQTHPDCRPYSGFMGLLSRLCRETRHRGYQRLCMHVRTSNGLNKVTRKIFSDSRSLRRLEDWYASGEAFDYIEASPVLRQGRDYTRKTRQEPIFT
jgi:hypothetical protein